MANENQDKSQGRLPKLLLVSYSMRRASYIIRGLAGAYLLYLMYQLFSEAKNSGEELSALMIAAGVFMIVAGVYFIGSALYALLGGIYAENKPLDKETEVEEAGEVPTEESL